MAVSSSKNRHWLLDVILILGAFAAAYLIIAHPWQKPPANIVSNSNVAQVKIKDLAITVEVADTPAARAQGLMFRNELPDDRGMLFIFDTSGYHSFWMRNTYIPLDIIWIAEGKIVHIENDIQPAGDNLFPQTYEPANPATHVLEVKGGVAEKKRMGSGDGCRIT